MGPYPPPCFWGIREDAREYLVADDSIMLIAALAIWLALLLFAFALCRRAARADDRDVALIALYLSGSATDDGTPVGMPVGDPVFAHAATGAGE